MYMQIDLMERHFTKSLALDLMGSKEKWVSGQGGPLTNSLQILCQDISAVLVLLHKVTI